MSRPLRVLALGAGVQSSTVLLMSVRGVLPKLDAAIFADTQWEPAGVYEHLAWLEQEAGRAGIPVHRVTRGSLRQHALESFVRGRQLEGQRYASMPMFVRKPGESGVGMIRRQCTQEYKIVPIDRFVRRELLGLGKGQRAPADAVDRWFGISSDELRRVRISRDHWARNLYPLAGLPDPMLDRPYTRLMCVDWLTEHYPDRIVPRSACIGCPFHSDEEWRRVRSDPEQWADAVEVDEAIRHSDGMDGEVYLHRSGRPLAAVDLRSDEQQGQMVMGFASECLGYCGS